MFYRAQQSLKQFGFTHIELFIGSVRIIRQYERQHIQINMTPIICTPIAGRQKTHWYLEHFVPMLYLIVMLLYQLR